MLRFSRADFHRRREKGKVASDQSSCVRLCGAVRGLRQSGGRRDIGRAPVPQVRCQEKP